MSMICNPAPQSPMYAVLPATAKPQAIPRVRREAREAKRHAALDSAEVSSTSSGFLLPSGGGPKRRRCLWRLWPDPFPLLPGGTARNGLEDIAEESCCLLG